MYELFTTFFNISRLLLLYGKNTADSLLTKDSFSSKFSTCDTGAGTLTSSSKHLLI